MPCRPNATGTPITAALDGVVAPNKRLRYDGGQTKIPCCIPATPYRPKPEALQLHINNVNGDHDHLKEWLRPLHGVAAEYFNHHRLAPDPRSSWS